VLRCGKSDGLCWRRVSCLIIETLIRLVPAIAGIDAQHAERLWCGVRVQYQKIFDSNGGCWSCFYNQGSNVNNQAELINDTMKKGWEDAFRRFDIDGSGSIDKGKLL
jgi:hypothetical protein